MKKIICLMLCALAAVTVCACGKDNTQTATEAATETPQIEETTAATPDETDGISLKSFIASFDKTPTVEEKVVYEEKDIKITLTGRNLLTFTKYTGIDPEVDNNLTMGLPGNTKQFLAGIELGF